MPSSSLLEARPDAGSTAVDRQPGVLRRRLDHPSVFLLVILAAQLMVVLDATIVNVALPHIQEGLHFSGTNLSWVLNAYVLAFGGLLLLGARSGDLLGRRRTFLAGITIFSLSSLAGGFAVTAWMLLAARAAQGVGAALAAPSSLALLTSVFPEGPKRLRAIAMFTTVSAAGGAIGLIAGGLITEWFSWRWVMFVNVPIGLVVILLGSMVLVETERRRGRFDVGGAVTSTAGMTAVVLGLVEAGARGWTAPITLASLVAGAVLLAAFVANEARASEPILPLRLLTDRTRSAANAARGLVYAGMYGMFFFLSQFLQDVKGYSPLRAGISFLPIPLAIFLSSQLTSRVLLNRFRPRAVMAAGISLAVVSLLLSTRLGLESSYPTVLADLVLLGIGSGISLVSLTSASLSGVAPEDAGAASGLVNVTQQIGAALGLAVLVTVFNAVTSHGQLAGGAASSLQSQETILNGLHVVFAAGAAFALLALGLVVQVIRPVSPPSAVAAPAMAAAARAAAAEAGEDAEIVDVSAADDDLSLSA